MKSHDSSKCSEDLAEQLQGIWGWWESRRPSQAAIGEMGVGEIWESR